MEQKFCQSCGMPLTEHVLSDCITSYDLGVRTPDLRNKTIQKAVESFRIADEQKALLKTLRIK